MSSLNRQSVWTCSKVLSYRMWNSAGGSEAAQAPAGEAAGRWKNHHIARFPASHPPPFTGSDRYPSNQASPSPLHCVLQCKVRECQQDPEYKLDRSEFWIRSPATTGSPINLLVTLPCQCLLSPQTQGGKVDPDCSPKSGHWENQVKTVSKSPVKRREAFEDTERNLGPELRPG